MDLLHTWFDGLADVLIKISVVMVGVNYMYLHFMLIVFLNKKASICSYCILMFIICIAGLSQGIKPLEHYLSSLKLGENVCFDDQL